MGASEPEATSIVLDLAGPAQVRDAFVLEPTPEFSYRFVLDLERTDDAEFLKHARLMPSAARSDAAPSIALDDESNAVAANRGADRVPGAQVASVEENQLDDGSASTYDTTVDGQIIVAEDTSEDFLWAPPVVNELSGSLIISEGRFFINPQRFDGQERHSISMAFEPEYYTEWENYTSLTIKPFLRVDSADSHRTHADLREAFLRYVGDDWELGLGFGKVFWGVTESVHLVDIINQTDAIENIDLEDKLGQPMINATLIRDWGFLDFFYLPYFRERTFQSRGGRIRNALVVDEHQTSYDSGAERWHPDFALRYANTFGDWDVGLYHFYGTNREPTLSVGFGSRGELVLVPRYELVNQTGTDIQYTTGAWLWKLEALFRQGQRNRLGTEQNYYAFAGGYEYTLYGIFGSHADLGLLTEYLRDSRLNKATSAFQNDVFLGARLALNDAQDTDLLAGMVQDLVYGTRLLSLEANRRIGNSFKLSLEMRLFTDVDREDVLSDMRDDDFFQLELGYYF